MRSICRVAEVRGRLSLLRNMFSAIWPANARNNMPGPYTNPFHPRATVANEMPDRVAYVIVRGFLRHVSLIPATRYSGLELGVVNILSVPSPSMALTQK